jgi:hypothetical protein
MNKVALLKIGLLTIIGSALLVGTYVLTVVWRVSAAQQECFGRSGLIPMSFPIRAFRGPPTKESCADRTFSYSHNGRNGLMWRQKLNGFQHIYGSALAAFELGDFFADKLFCANEFAEALCDWNAITANDRLDRKKDLWNNRIGRAIGVRVSQMGLAGSDAKHRIMLECVLTVEEDPQFLGHYLDNRVLMLSERKLGCLFLPRYNVFNLLLQTF